MSCSIATEELEWMGEAVEALMIETCTIQSVTYSSDGAGGQTESVSSTTSACRATPNVRRALIETQQSGQVTEITEWKFWLPLGTAINRKDRIAYNSQTFEAQAVIDNGTAMAAIQVTATRIGLQA